MPTTPKKTPRQARVYPTLEAWCSREENRAFVNGLLNEPMFLALLHYAKDIQRVQVSDLIGTTAQLNECIIRKAAIHAGACAFEDALRTILKSGGPSATHVPDDYGHTIPLTK